ncbi:hypothetical protein GGX14DRAFT_99005, partial [Mycena pura]
AAPSKRSAGTIAAPLSGTAISSGEAVAFTYHNVNQCEAGYTAISVWLSVDAPATLNASGGLDDYVDFFGNYLIGNFGLPPLSGSAPPPPPTLMMPDLSSYASGTALYFTVVETIAAHSCPPEGVVPATDEYIFSTTALTVA